MDNITTYINSGVLELYVMGIATREEVEQVEKLAVSHSEVADAIREISLGFENYADAHAIEPHGAIKPMLLATVDYMERLAKGEEPAFPPVLGENSRVSDYKEWLERKDLAGPADEDNIHARVIGYTPEIMTAIVWIKESTPLEIHDKEFERFLIVEGTCDIVIDDKPHKLGPGDYMQIPLHAGHHVQVTSVTRCKVILQRVAA
jgi:mannose-6-phosphate isomerase-like protein (cupin superfamily)